MKIAFGSDIHLEFGPLEIKENAANADVLVLAGDIFVGNRLEEGEKRFVDACCSNYKNVIYIVGNHEAYHCVWEDVRRDIKKLTSGFENFHFLENETIDIDDVTFFGGTLWTNMNERDPYVVNRIQFMMNDFRLIRKDGDIFLPIHAAQEHDVCLKAMTKAVEGKDKVVVVSHHAPSKKSIHPKYKSDVLMNYGYHSDLESFIEERPQIKLWIHGHTHTDFDYNVGSTRIVCNPRGYINYEPRASKFEFKTVEV